jgi:hypothetical protein
MDALHDTLGQAPLASGARQLQSGGNFSDYTDAYLLFFGLQLAFFVTMPLVIMLWRAVRSLRSRSFGFMVMLKAPIGRVGDKRSPAAALRFFLFQETSLGYYADVAQVSRGGGEAALPWLARPAAVQAVPRCGLLACWHAQSPPAPSLRSTHSHPTPTPLPLPHPRLSSLPSPASCSS